MKKALLAVFSLVAALYLGCTQDSAEKILYDMEKLVYTTGRMIERINIQPQLSSAADSLALKAAYEKILTYYYTWRDHPLVVGDEAVGREMNQIAVGVQVQLARYYRSLRKVDSAITAFGRIGTEIPAGREDIANASLSIALIYRSTGQFDSTLARYDRLQREYYPPLDSLDRVNPDIIAIPIDRISIQRGLNRRDQMEASSRQALEYYSRLLEEYPDNAELTRRAVTNTARVYAMNEQWDETINWLSRLTDSTGQTDIRAASVIANIYSGPKSDLDQAVVAYRQILDREPDSAIIGSTMLQLGAALCSQDKHEEGRKVLADLKKKFGPYPQLMAPAQFFYAQSFEKQGRWDRALSEYQWLMENYPYSEDAFRVARHIPDRFARENDAPSAEIWYDRAVDFYLRAANARKGHPIEVVAYSGLADIYRVQKQWDKVMETLGRIHALAPESRLGAQALYNAAVVAANELKDSVLARDYLNQLAQKYGTTDSTQIYQEEQPEIDLESIE